MVRNLTIALLLSLLSFIGVAAVQAAPSEGAEFTIFVQRFAGPNHVQQATSYRDALARQTPMNRWYVIHKEGESLLYHGYYAEIDPDINPQAAAQARNDKQQIDSLANPQGDPLFRGTTLVRLDAPDPAAPPQWDLSNANGRWTIVIAGYTGSVERKQAAVDSVKAAREAGYEAYYWHGPSVSNVCIGVWPDAAAQEVNPAANRAVAEDRTILTSNVPLPESFRRNIRDEEGRHLAVIQPKFNIFDQSMADTLAEFPEYHLNGALEARRIEKPDGTVTTQSAGTFVADLRQLSDFGGNGGDPVPETRRDEQTPNLLTPGNRRREGGLRSIGGE